MRWSILMRVATIVAAAGMVVAGIVLGLGPGDELGFSLALGGLGVVLGSAIVTDRLPEGSAPSVRGILEHLLRIAVPALGVIGVVVYGLLYISYYSFYSTFSLQLEDVGLTYASLLASSIGVVLAVTATGGYVAAGYAAGAFVFVRARSDADLWPLLRSAYVAKVVRQALVTMGIACGISLVMLSVAEVHNASNAADAVRYDAVESTGPINTYLGVPIVETRPPAVRLVPLADDAPPAPSTARPCDAGNEVRRDTRYYYLGGTSDTMVFFDAGCQHTLTVPRGSVTLVLPTSR